jgi:hypothetical protein
MKMSDAKNPKWTKAWWEANASDKTHGTGVGEALDAYSHACGLPDKFTADKEFADAIEACDKLQTAINKAKPLCRTFQKETYACLETYENESKAYHKELIAIYQTWKAGQDNTDKLNKELLDYFGKVHKELKDIHDRLDNLHGNVQLFVKRIEAHTPSAEDFQKAVGTFTTVLNVQQQQRQKMKEEWPKKALLSVKATDPAVARLVSEVTKLDSSLREQDNGLEKHIRDAIAGLKLPAQEAPPVKQPAAAPPPQTAVSIEKLRRELESFKKLHEKWTSSVGLLRQAMSQKETPDQYQLMGAATDTRKVEIETVKIEQQRNGALQELQHELAAALRQAPHDTELRKLADDIKDYKPVSYKVAVSGVA